MKKLMFSGNTAWGMYHFRQAVLTYFVQKGYKVIVTAPFDNSYSQKIENLGCEVYNMPVKAKSNNPFSDLWLLYKYWKLMRKLHPDISITYTIKPNIYANIASATLNIPCLPIVTGLGYVFLNKGLVSNIARLLYKISFQKAAQVWFLNKDDIDTFKQQHLISDNKVNLLNGEGIDLNRYDYTTIKERREGNLSFLFIGRLLWDKGVKEYIEASQIVSRQYPECKFKLIGAIWENNPRAISEEQVKKWKEQNCIEYMGSKSDVRPYIQDCDCLVLPSYREGIPMSLMEGAATGIPLIASDVPGCHDVVEDGYNGFLCEVKSANDLAAKMIKMIKMSFQERQQMGANGRKLMEKKFAMPLIIQKYEEAIQSINVRKKISNDTFNKINREYANRK